eukprot:scaffold14661_cov207-Skeletonema_marinoi.AAC.1
MALLRRKWCHGVRLVRVPVSCGVLLPTYVSSLIYSRYRQVAPGYSSTYQSRNLEGSCETYYELTPASAEQTCVSSLLISPVDK